jgi:hypothetical protein
MLTSGRLPSSAKQRFAYPISLIIISGMNILQGRSLAQPTSQSTGSRSKYTPCYPDNKALSSQYFTDISLQHPVFELVNTLSTNHIPGYFSIIGRAGTGKSNLIFKNQRPFDTIVIAATRSLAEAIKPKFNKAVWKLL